MTRRGVAKTIIRMRRLLIVSVLARMTEDHPLEAALSHEFTTLANKLPLAATVRGGLFKYVNDPAARTINREGILAQRHHLDTLKGEQ